MIFAHASFCWQCTIRVLASFNFCKQLKIQLFQNMYLLSLSKTSSEWLVLKLTYGSLCMFLSMGGTEYHLKEFFPCHIKTPWDTGVKIKQPFVSVFFGWLVFYFVVWLHCSVPLSYLGDKRNSYIYCHGICCMETLVSAFSNIKQHCPFCNNCL